MSEFWIGTLSIGSAMTKTSPRFITIAIVALIPDIVMAAVMDPVGAADGDVFRRVFVTSTVRDATSDQISDYDTFVNDRAMAAI